MGHQRLSWAGSSWVSLVLPGDPHLPHGAAFPPFPGPQGPSRSQKPLALQSGGWGPPLRTLPRPVRPAPHPALLPSFLNHALPGTPEPCRSQEMPSCPPAPKVRAEVSLLWWAAEADSLLGADWGVAVSYEETVVLQPQTLRHAWALMYRWQILNDLLTCPFDGRLAPGGWRPQAAHMSCKRQRQSHDEEGRVLKGSLAGPFGGCKTLCGKLGLARLGRYH